MIHKAMTIKAKRILPSFDDDGTIGLGFFSSDDEPTEETHIAHIETTPEALLELLVILKELEPQVRVSNDR
jgi:hypothetical protein